MNYLVGDIVKLDMSVQSEEVTQRNVDVYGWALHCPYVEILENWDDSNPYGDGTHPGLWTRAKMYNGETGRTIDDYYVWLTAKDSTLIERNGVRVNEDDPTVTVTHDDGTTVTTPLEYHVTSVPEREVEILWTEAELQAASEQNLASSRYVMGAPPSPDTRGTTTDNPT